MHYNALAPRHYVPPQLEFHRTLASDRLLFAALSVRDAVAKRVLKDQSILSIHKRANTV